MSIQDAHHALWLGTAKMIHDAAGFTAQVIILNHQGQISAGYASVLTVCKFADETCEEKADCHSRRSWNIALNYRNLLVLSSLLWFLASPGVLGAPALGPFAAHDMRQTVAVGVFKAVGRKAVGAGSHQVCQRWQDLRRLPEYCH